MADDKDSKLEVWFRPDWHPALNPILGDVKGAYAYVTDAGTIRLLGPLYEDPDISKFASESNTDGPTVSLSAKPSLGII